MMSFYCSESIFKSVTAQTIEKRNIKSRSETFQAHIPKEKNIYCKKIPHSGMRSFFFSAHVVSSLLQLGFCTWSWKDLFA